MVKIFKLIQKENKQKANAKSHTHCQVSKTSHINQNLSISMSLPAQIEINENGKKAKGTTTHIKNCLIELNRMILKLNFITFKHRKIAF